ncbi:hypothetical protein ZIOFF_047478 [Zingiber officinale]|uniref:DDE Tnp4 domain-containing protein n=1 Tax=Zingiber officinale TaxID=94328 RepID=A0A8J5KTQ1_ZINOF|nr:hypothetical protein ZIOFF_047478 [Zingiber officinale]
MLCTPKRLVSAMRPSRLLAYPARMPSITSSSDEVWEDYFKSHPKHEHYRTDTFEDYEDLRLVVGNGTATGKYTIGLGDDTDARTFETEENGGTNLLDDYVFDHNSGEFIQSNRQESSYQPLFSEDLASPLPSQPMSSEVPQATRKRDRSEFEAKSSTSKNIDLDVLNRLSYTIEKASSKIELVGVANDNYWDAIKQVPNLDNRTRYKALDWLNTRAKKVAFLKMTIEERLDQNFNKVLKALKSIAVDMMVKPGSAVPEKIRESTRFYPYFKDCIGAIDGTHILAMVSGGWEGSAHDSLVLTDALLRNNGLKVPGGKYFLVDGGYPNRRQFLAPFRGVRYHLQEFTGQGRHPENAKELFNLRHASLRNAIERIFGSVILMNFQLN